MRKRKSCIHSWKHQDYKRIKVIIQLKQIKNEANNGVESAQCCFSAGFNVPNKSKKTLSTKRCCHLVVVLSYFCLISNSSVGTQGLWSYEAIQLSDTANGKCEWLFIGRLNVTLPGGCVPINSQRRGTGPGFPPRGARVYTQERVGWGFIENLDCSLNPPPLLITQPPPKCPPSPQTGSPRCRRGRRIGKKSYCTT